LKINIWFVLLIITFYILTGCQNNPDLSTSTPVLALPTSAPELIDTAQSTNTPLPTYTPKPTSTPITPTPTIPPPDVLGKYLENVHVVEYDNFDNPAKWNASYEISNGEMKLTGLGGSDWRGLANPAYFQEGEGVVINFKFTPGAFFELFFENGAYESDLYKRFGVYINKGYAENQFFPITDGTYRLSGDLFLKSETLYSLFMVAGKDGDLLTLIWDPSKPDQTLRYREVVKSWSGINWTFRIQANEGTIIFDDFMKIEFDGIK